MIGLKDIITLAKAGYSLADIKEVSSLAIQEVLQPETPETPETPDTSETPGTHETPETPGTHETPETIDALVAEYEHKLNELNDKITVLTAKLNEAQKHNINVNNSSNIKKVDPIDSLTDLFRKG